MPHTFLSDEWLNEAKKIRDEFASDAPNPAADLTVNVVVTDGPEGDRELHMANGVFDTGLIDNAPTKLTLPYEVAKDMFINGNQQAAMQAFMSGQIKVEGDMTKLMAMQTAGASDPNREKVQERLKEITAT
jgi:putative sterol carrier protein